MDTPLFLATVGLAVATVALVCATRALAQVASRQDKRDELLAQEAAQRNANRIVPELYSLHVRLVGAAEVAGLHAKGDLSKTFRTDWFPDYRTWADELHGYRDATLTYSIEVLALRHFLRLAEHAWERCNVQGGGDWHEVELNLIAARVAIDAALAEIPEDLRKIEGDEYWPRFKSVREAHLRAARSELESET